MGEMDKKKQKLMVVSGIDFDRSYAGTQHLLEHLSASFDISLYVLTTPRSRPWYEQLPHTCHVFPFGGPPLFGRRFRLMSKVFRIGIFLRMLFARQLLITETTYLREAAWAKKIRGKWMVFTQFCQELVLPEEYPQERWPATQKRFARVPDVVIDVDPFRAKIRKEYYGLARMPYVLRNTIPLSQMPPRAPRGRLWELAGIPSPPEGMPVLVHAGGVGREKPFDRIIDTVAALDRPMFLLAFCAATEEQIQYFRNDAAQKLAPGSFHLSPTVPREQLRASLWEADVGVVDYTFSVEPTVNQKYCAPTKLYEFMACGLAILGSNNDSLRDVIERDGIGCCATGDDVHDLAAALKRLLGSDMEDRKEKARAVFTEKYCYEKACSGEVLKIAGELLERSKKELPFKERNP
jgi:glycosyltransferase involved in cell wall biosynthesis